MKFIPRFEEKKLYGQLWDDAESLAEKYGLEFHMSRGIMEEHVYFQRITKKGGWFSVDEKEGIAASPLLEGESFVYDEKYVDLGKELDKLLFDFRKRRGQLIAKYNNGLDIE